MSLIEKYVEERLSVIEEARIPKPIKFSVSIEYETNFRLQYVAKMLETNRANLAAEFIQLAIVEAEKALGINPMDFESDYGKSYLENCCGSFYQDDTGYYRVTEDNQKIKLVDSNMNTEEGSTKNNKK